MDLTDLNEMKAEFYDFMSNEWQVTIVYRMLDTAMSVTNDRFGITEVEATTDVTLFASVIHRPMEKVKAKMGVVSDATLIAILSTQELENKHLTLSREKGALVYCAQEYEILSIDPRPQIFDSSISTIVSCKERKPLNG